LIGNSYRYSIYDSYATGNVTGTSNVGGFIGDNNYYTYSYRSYATGNVTATSGSAGGFAGYTYYSRMFGVFSSGDVTGSTAGGLIGTASTSTQCGTSDASCNWDIYRSGYSGCIGSGSLASGTCTGRNSGNSQPTYFYDASNIPMSDWDFTDIWEEHSSTYPTLRWTYYTEGWTEIASPAIDRICTPLVFSSNSTASSTANGSICFGVWQHMCISRESSGTANIYKDGSLDGAADQDSGTPAAGSSLEIGGFKGKIDELLIFDTLLSLEQIGALAANRTDLIVSQETSEGETWEACITPNDGKSDGTTECASMLVNNQPPLAINMTVNATDNPLNRTTANLTGYYNFFDYDSGDSETASEKKWYVDGVENATLAGNTTIGLGNTSRAEIWTFSVRVKDEEDWSEWANASIEILNTPPTHGTPVLNTTYGFNLTSENITVYNQSTADIDGNTIKNIISWYLDNESLMVLNMPFEGGST
jgi:hypothetical protein